MTALAHILVFLIASGVIWFFTGILIDSVDRVAKRFHRTGFTVAFFVLGFMTSISEISIMVNSTLTGNPQVSAGNLVGASFVILLFLVPLLAVMGNGIKFRKSVSRNSLIIALLIVLTPALLLIDGSIRVRDGVLLLMAYAVLAYMVRKSQVQGKEVMEEVEEALLQKTKASGRDIFKVVLGGVMVFAAGHYLIEETVFFSNYIGVPRSIIGLLILSIGTNIPEIVIATRAISKKRADIALGDYLGSAVTNTFVFGLLAVLNGGFQVERSEFIYTAVLMFIGLGALFYFSQTKNHLSKKEGWGLLAIYGVFVLIQIIGIIRFAVE